jgi:hypothetical protein
MEIVESDKKGKRFKAIFKNGKILYFGSATGKAFIDHGDELKKKNYIKRHQVNEDWFKINPGSLSRFILWGDSKDIKTNIKTFIKKFNI